MQPTGKLKERRWAEGSLLEPELAEPRESAEGWQQGLAAFTVDIVVPEREKKQ
jgi:hypothetical protein